MVVLRSLRTALATLLRNPVLLVPAFLVSLVQLPQLGARLLGPLLAGVVSLVVSLAFVLVLPFVQGGLLAMADEAIDGRTDLGTFVAAGRSHYVSMLVAYLLLLGAAFAYYVVAFVVFVVVFVVVLGSGLSSATTPATLVILGVLALAFLLVYLVAALLVQFYGQAIVLDGRGAIGGFRRSVGLVRRNVLATLGYSLVVFVVAIVFGGVAAVASLLLSAQRAALPSLPTLSPGVAVLVAVLVVVVTTVLAAFFVVYSVAFYRGTSARDVRRSAT